jgi:hypothetical protein
MNTKALALLAPRSTPIKAQHSTALNDERYEYVNGKEQVDG